MGSVKTIFKGGMLFESMLGQHRILVDGPEEWGGQDRGPTPPQLFMTSISSCVGVLVTHFCNDHHLDPDGLSVDVEYDVASHPTRFNNIRVKVSLPNAECGDECTKKALEHVAKHCPIHETIVTLEQIKFEITTK